MLKTKIIGFVALMVATSASANGGGELSRQLNDNQRPVELTDYESNLLSGLKNTIRFSPPKNSGETAIMDMLYQNYPDLDGRKSALFGQYDFDGDGELDIFVQYPVKSTMIGVKKISAFRRSELGVDYIGDLMGKRLRVSDDGGLVAVQPSGQEFTYRYEDGGFTIDLSDVGEVVEMASMSFEEVAGYLQRLAPKEYAFVAASASEGDQYTMSAFNLVYGDIPVQVLHAKNPYLCDTSGGCPIWLLQVTEGGGVSVLHKTQADHPLTLTVSPTSPSIPRSMYFVRYDELVVLEFDMESRQYVLKAAMY